MKFLKTFLGLFFAMYIPMLILVGFFIKPGKMSTGTAMVSAAVPLGLLLAIISLGFALVSQAMDSNKPKN